MKNSLLLLRSAVFAQVQLIVAGETGTALNQMSPQTGNDWTIAFSPGMPTTLNSMGADRYFDFPKIDGIHYVYRHTNSLAFGQTINMHFAVQGSGTIAPTEGPMPARVRLFLQQRHDGLTAAEEFKRWWSVNNIELKSGEYVLTASLVAGQWTSVFAKSNADYRSQFAHAISEIAHVGFTFGGMFAGHGVFARDGSARFILRKFEVVQ